MRNVKQDETLHLCDSAIMADCLRQGVWFGNEGAGVHGFLFKLPEELKGRAALMAVRWL